MCVYKIKYTRAMIAYIYIYKRPYSRKAIGAFDLSFLPFTVSLLTNPKLSIAIPVLSVPVPP